MKISILISSYNKGAYIEECLNSCLNQTYQDYEIILLDNYSNDNTDIILEKYRKNIIIKKEKKISNNSAANQLDLLKKAFMISSGVDVLSAVFFPNAIVLSTILLPIVLIKRFINSLDSLEIP